MILYADTERLQTLLGRVLASPHSDFYRQLVGTVPVDTSLTALPFLTRAHLAGTLPDDRCYVPKAAVRFVGYTSGTTSGQPLVLYVGDVPNYFVEPSLGLPVERLLITYPPLNKNFGASFVRQCAEAKTPVTPVFGDYQQLANSAVLAAYTQCDTLYATPTIALHLAPLIKAHYNPGAFKLLALASELLTETQRQALQDAYPHAAIANLYASAEVGQFILTPCPHLVREGAGHLHLLTEALVAAEIVEGELVLTLDQNPALPLLRYKTGDGVRVVREVCNCGRGPVLALTGRPHVDVVRLHGFELRADVLDAACARLGVSSTEYRCHLQLEEGELELSLAVLSAPGRDSEELTRGLAETIMVTSTLSLSEALAAGHLSSFTVTLVPALPVTAKHQRITTEGL